MNWTENDIQSLKAQEAKDLAVEFMHQLLAKERGPISPGEVQLKELEFELKLRDAENEDNRVARLHEKQIKELALKIDQEKTRAAEAISHADEVRQEHAGVIQRVSEASESLSTQLERLTREHNLKTERLTTAYEDKKGGLATEIDQLKQQRDALKEEISHLTGVQDHAQEVASLREEIKANLKQAQRERDSIEDEVAQAEHEKTKRVRNAQRQQELELAELAASHKRDVLNQNRDAAEAIIKELGMTALPADELEQLKSQLHQQSATERQESEHVLAEARTSIRREYNITRDEPIDVTELFYREQASSTQADALRGQIDKLDTEVRRMREHIEQEPQRIATAVEAAKTQVQNYIEQSGKR